MPCALLLAAAAAAAGLGRPVVGLSMRRFLPAPQLAAQLPAPPCCPGPCADLRAHRPCQLRTDQPRAGRQALCAHGTRARAWLAVGPGSRARAAACLSAEESTPCCCCRIPWACTHAGDAACTCCPRLAQIDDSNNAPEFFRTRGALARTMAHLRGLLDRGGARLGLVHKFLWDRYRSVRQDLYIQGMDVSGRRAVLYGWQQACCLRGLLAQGRRRCCGCPAARTARQTLAAVCAGPVTDRACPPALCPTLNDTPRARAGRVCGGPV